MNEKPTFHLVLEAVPDPHNRPALDRLKQLLKRALRDFRLRAVEVRPVDSGGKDGKA